MIMEKMRVWFTVVSFLAGKRLRSPAMKIEIELVYLKKIKLSYLPLRKAGISYLLSKSSSKVGEPHESLDSFGS